MCIGGAQGSPFPTSDLRFHDSWSWLYISEVFGRMNQTNKCPFPRHPNTETENGDGT